MARRQGDPDPPHILYYPRSAPSPATRPPTVRHSGVRPADDRLAFHRHWARSLPGTLPDPAQRAAVLSDPGKPDGVTIPCPLPATARAPPFPNERERIGPAFDAATAIPLPRAKFAT